MFGSEENSELNPELPLNFFLLDKKPININQRINSLIEVEQYNANSEAYAHYKPISKIIDWSIVNFNGR